MLERYNIIEADETADALRRADAWLSTQPKNHERHQGGGGRRPDGHRTGTTFLVPRMDGAGGGT